MGEVFLPGQVTVWKGLCLPWASGPWVPWPCALPCPGQPPPQTPSCLPTPRPRPALGSHSAGLPVEGQMFPKASHARFSLQKVPGEALAHATRRARPGRPGPTPTRQEAEAPAPS